MARIFSTDVENIYLLALEGRVVFHDIVQLTTHTNFYPTVPSSVNQIYKNYQ